MKKLLPILLSAVLLCPLAGCWDHLEVSKMLIVAGIGLDSAAGGQLYHATVEIVNVAAEGGKNITAELVEGWGVTLHAAIQDATKMTGGILFGNHCKVIVLGDSLARAGISGVVETVLRSPQYRKTVDLLVAKDGTAADILKSKTVNNDIVSYELASITKSNAETLRTTIPTGVYELHEALVSDCSYAVVPAVSLHPNNGRDVPEVDGCAVFAGDKLQGYLDGEDSRLLSLLLRGPRGQAARLDEAALSLRPLDLRLDAGRVALRPALQGDALSLQVEVRADCSLREAVMDGLDLSDEAAVQSVERAAGQQLAVRLERLIHRVQAEYGADVFGFYREFQDRYRREWDSLSGDWETHFRTLAVTVSCEVKLTGSGLIANYTPHNSTSEGGNALP